MKKLSMWALLLILLAILPVGMTPALAQTEEPGDTERDMLRAGVLLEHRGYAEAEQIYTGIIEQEPSALPAYLGLVDVYVAVNQTDSAIATCQEILAIAPDDSSALYRLSDIYLRQKRYEEAIPLYQKIVAQDPSLFNKEMLAVLYYKEQRYLEGVPLFEELIAAYPDKEDLQQMYRRVQLAAEQEEVDRLVQAGNAALRANRPAEALALFQEASGYADAPSDIASRIEEAEQALFFEKTAPYEQSALQGDMAAAQEVLKMIDELKDRPTGIFAEKVQRLRNKILLARADFAFGEGDLDAAYLDLQELEAIYDEDITALTRQGQLKLHELLGQICYVRGDYEQAEEYFQKVKNQEPGYEGIGQESIDDALAKTRFRLNLWHHVIVWIVIVGAIVAGYLTRARWLPPLTLKYYLYAGKQTFRDQDWMRSRRYHEMIRKQMTRPPAAVLNRLITIYQNLGMDDEAEQVAHEAIAGGEKNWDNYLTLINRYLKKKEYDAAKKLLAEAEPQARSNSQKSALARIRLAIAEARGEWRAAAAVHLNTTDGRDINEARKQIELWIRADDREQAEKALRMYYRKYDKDWQWVLSQYKKLHAQHPESPYLAVTIGNIYEAQRRVDDAIACYEKVIASVPRKEKIWRKLIPLYEGKNDYAAAVNALEHLLPMIEPEPVLLLSAARDCRQLQQYEKAVEYYFRVLQIEQDNVESYRQLVEIGRYYISQGDHARAVEIFEQILEIAFFDKVEVRYELGKSLYRLGEYDAAIKHLQQVTRGSNVIRYQAKNFAALCLLKKGMADLALAQLDEIPIDQHGFPPELYKAVLYNRGLVLEAAGDRAGAVAIFKKVMLIDIEYKDTAARLERLKGE